jgi:hypothetical protein
VTLDRRRGGAAAAVHIKESQSVVRIVTCNEGVTRNSESRRDFLFQIVVRSHVEGLGGQGGVLWIDARDRDTTLAPSVTH